MTYVVILLAVATPALTRSLVALLRAQLPQAELHGPFATEDEAAAYFLGRDDLPVRADYALVEHELADGPGAELARGLRRRFSAPVFVLPEGADARPYEHRALAYLRVGEFERELPRYLIDDRLASPALLDTGVDYRALAAEVRGERPVAYRSRIVQLLADEAPDDAGRERLTQLWPMAMTLGAIAHFYADDGYAWAQAHSGNLNRTPYALDELEASLQPAGWFRINERQIVRHLGIDVDFDLERAVARLSDGEPLRLRLYRESVLDNAVNPQRLGDFLLWYDAGEPDDEPDDDFGDDDLFGGPGEYPF